MKNLITSALCLLSLSVVSVAHAVSGDGGTGGGKIYFQAGGAQTMNSDGTAKTLLPPNVSGEPSRALHGGHRWFLQSRQIPGEFYPNGSARHELFAVRGDGDEAFTRQLTDQPDLQRVGSLGNLRWATDATVGAIDGLVSLIGRRWDLTTGTVVAGGIYAEEIVFDSSGNVIGLAAQPTAPIVPAALVNTGTALGPDIRDHDWSPTGSEIAFARHAAPELRISNLAGVTRLLYAGSSFLAQPVWSPSNTRIAFASSAGIEAINPDGTKRSRVRGSTPSTSVYAPVWSPTGSHIAYRFEDRRGNLTLDVYRSTATGGSVVNLTADIGTAVLVGWR